MNVSLPRKFKIAILFISILFVGGLSFFAGKIYAADAIPGGGNIPCDASPSNPEFNSDRPYQASRCGPYNITYWCGNGVVINSGSVSTKWDASTCSDTSCPVDFNCTKNGAVAGGGKGGSCSGFQNIIVDLSNVQLPVLGNTQLTKNSQNASDQIDEATQVNEYISQYLNGVTNKAENGNEKSTDGDVVNFSGPIQKLLPGSIQDAARISSILQAATNQTYTTDNDGEQGSQSKSVSEPQNHNQIVVCESGGKAVPCYSGGGAKANGELRLKDWYDGDLSILNKFLNWVGISAWDKKYPPLPWQFDKDIYYQKAYNEWRGKQCVILPVINRLVCVDVKIPGVADLVTNKWADLFPYVPLANTVDKKGVHMVTGLSPSAAKAQVELADHGYDLIRSPQLYLAHSLENFQLTDLLKSTFKPGNPPGVGGASGQANLGSTSTSDVEAPSCKIIPSRSNPGDDATFDKPKSYIEIDNLNIHVSEIDCEKSVDYVCSVAVPKGTKCPPGSQTEVIKHTCKSDVYVTIPSVAKYGYVNDIWNNTVAGSDSIFRRIYPKTGPDAPVSCIADNPAVSKATYTIESGGDLFRIIEPDGSSVKADGGSAKSIDAQLYYPHYGSVYDYFLKGIQTALRPLGYADPSPASGQNCTNITCGELPQGLPKASGSCTLGGTSSRVGKIPGSLKQIIEAASQTYKTPPNLILGIMFGEGLFEPNRLNWSDQNVKNWATCQKVPNCSETGDDNFMGFNGNDFKNIAPHIIKDLQKLDPTKTESSLSQCNLLDAIYAEAYNLHASAAGGGGLPATCFGISLNSTIPSSCTWNDGQYESAIKVAESGYTSSCLTKENSCATGGGLDAACPSGDTCETITNRYTNPSHNACVWDVGHGR